MRLFVVLRVDKFFNSDRVFVYNYDNSYFTRRWKWIYMRIYDSMLTDYLFEIDLLKYEVKSDIVDVQVSEVKMVFWHYFWIIYNLVVSGVIVEYTYFNIGKDFEQILEDDVLFFDFFDWLSFRYVGLFEFEFALNLYYLYSCIIYVSMENIYLKYFFSKGILFSDVSFNIFNKYLRHIMGYLKRVNRVSNIYVSFNPKINRFQDKFDILSAFLIKKYYTYVYADATYVNLNKNDSNYLYKYIYIENVRHGTLLEIIWTVLPTIILVLIALHLLVCYILMMNLLVNLVLR